MTDRPTPPPPSPWQAPPAWQPTPPWQSAQPWEPPQQPVPAPVLGQAPWPPPTDGLAQRPPSRERLRSGLLVGLVLVLLAMCGGIALTAWAVIPPNGGPTAVGASPVASPLDGTPSRKRVVATPSGVATPVAGPTVAPAGSPPVPFGISHAVIWPDHLQAVVYRARVNDLPVSLAQTRPDDVAVVISIRINNNSAVDVQIRQARLNLWYGPDRKQAETFADPASRTGTGFDGTIRSGDSLVGDFAFVIPPEYVNQLVIEFRPRPGDAPGRFTGSAD